MAFPDLSFRFGLDAAPRFLSCGRFVATEGWSHPERVIDSWELVVGVAGKAFIFEERPDGRGKTAVDRFEVNPGDTLILAPGRRHGGWAPSSADSSFIWLHFSPSGAGPRSRENAVTLPRFLRGGMDSRLRVALGQLLDSSRDPACPRSLPDYLCGIALMELSRSHAGRPARYGREKAGGLAWFDALAEWAIANIEGNMGVEDLARRSGRNADYLNRVFRKRFGISALEWIHRAKLDRAREFLMTTDLPVKAVADRLGFTDATGFCRFFKRECGLTPVQFRNEWTRGKINKS